MATLLTPRPLPARRLPMVGGALVVAFCLPVFVLAGWSLRGWALGAVLWLAGQMLSLLLTRLRPGVGNLAASGVVGISMMFRAVAVGVVVIAVAASDPELALSLLTYFGSEPLS